MKPEDRARLKIDEKLRAAGWVVQDLKEANLTANRGVAIREAQLPRGSVDYGLFVDGKALGSLEAKPEGCTLAGVEQRSIEYAAEPGGIATWKEDRLPFTFAAEIAEDLQSALEQFAAIAEDLKSDQ